MISSPYKQRRIIFHDWDDTVIGVLCLPEILRDVRAFADFFIAVNLVHPDINGGPIDEWAAEREELYRQAVHDWPRRWVYPEESWYFEARDSGPILRHALRYLPGGYVPEHSLLKAFRPKKEGEKMNPDQFMTEDGKVFHRVRFLTIDGKQYVELSEEYYQALLDERERSRNVRYRGVEEFRLWCKANKGTDTVEEGLRACTVRELYEAANDLYVDVNGWTYAINLVYELYRRMEVREKLTEAARRDVAPEPIMPEEDAYADHP